MTESRKKCVVAMTHFKITELLHQISSKTSCFRRAQAQFGQCFFIRKNRNCSSKFGRVWL